MVDQGFYSLSESHYSALTSLALEFQKENTSPWAGLLANFSSMLPVIFMFASDFEFNIPVA